MQLERVDIKIVGVIQNARNLQQTSIFDMGLGILLLGWVFWDIGVCLWFLPFWVFLGQMQLDRVDIKIVGVLQNARNLQQTRILYF